MPCGGPYLYGHVNKPHEECPRRDVKYDGVGPRMYVRMASCVHTLQLVLAGGGSMLR